MCTGQVIKQSGKGCAVVCKVFRTGLQKLDLSFQPQKQCAYIFINGMEFFPEPMFVEINSMSCVIESRAEGRVRQTADAAVKQNQKETTADFRRTAVRFTSQQTILQHPHNGLWH